MYVELAKIFLSAVFFRATNIFGMKTAAAYLALSLALMALKPEANMPATFLITTAFVYAVYVASGILKHMTKEKLKETPKKQIPSMVPLFVPIFSIGYLFAFFNLGFYMSLVAVFALFFALRALKIKDSVWGLVFAGSLIHAMLTGGLTRLVHPATYAFFFVFLARFFLAAKDAFSFACKPKDLKEGMVPAETVFWDGKKYRFDANIFPGKFWLLRQILRKKAPGKRIVASFFSPLKKENVIELKKISKKYKKPVFYIQKKTAVLPFLFAGAVIVLFL